MSAAAPRVAIIATGEMGSAIGAALAAHGVMVLTSVEGRSAASGTRARQAGFRLVDSDDELIADADMLLSVVPPGAALALAGRLASVLERAVRRPIYVDCNAVAPQTVAAIEAKLAGTRVVDAGLFGGPTSGKPGIVFYASGPAAGELSVLDGRGVSVNVMDGPVGAASALKLSFAGLNKGFTAIGAMMILAAMRSGSEGALIEQLASSQPGIFAYVRRFVPAMFPKAYRWEPEMEEIATFVQDDPEARAVFEALARLYRRLGQQVAQGNTGEIATLRAFCDRAMEEAAR